MGAISSTGMSIGTAAIAASNPVGWAIAGGSLAIGLAGSLLGHSSANKAADYQSQAVTAQNQIFAEEHAINKANMLTQRRQMFRQEAVALAGARFSASSGTSRSTSLSTVNESIKTTTAENVASIDKSIASGEKISALNQQVADLSSKAAAAQARGGFFSNLL